MTTVTASKFTFERLEDRIAPSALLISAGLGLGVGVGGGGDCHTAAPPKDDFSACAPPKDDFSSASCRPSTPALGLKVGLNALLGVVLGGRH